MNHFAYTYPWNVFDTAAFADEAMACGMNGVNLAVSYHAGKFIHPTSVGERVFFPEDGTVYFQPHRKYGLLRPRVANQTMGRDIVADIAREMPVNGWMVLAHNSRLGFSHPECTVRNAFGDPYYYSLCPSNPHVRQYCITLAGDFAANNDVQSVLVETPGFLTYAHGYHHEFALVRPNAYLDMLLGLCFCEHCCAGAKAQDIDFHGLRRDIREAVDTYLALDREFDDAEGNSRRDDANAEIDGLAEFHRFRAAQVTSLVKEIRAEVRRGVAVTTIATCQRPHKTAYLEGMDLPALANAADGIECPLYQPDFADLTEDLEWLKSNIDPSTNSAILRPAWPDWFIESQLREAFAMVREAGFEQINFYNFGMLRPANRRWLANLLMEHT